MGHSKHSQIMYMTSVLITQYRYAMQTSDRETKKKIAETKRTLYRYKKYYYAEER